MTAVPRSLSVGDYHGSERAFESQREVSRRVLCSLGRTRECVYAGTSCSKGRATLLCSDPQNGWSSLLTEGECGEI